MRNLGFRTLDDVVTVGTNGKMSEVCAAMGLTGLESVDQFIRVNYDNYCHYRQALGHLRGVSMMSFGEDQRSNYQYIVLEIDEAEAGLSRDDLMHVLHAENIRAPVHGNEGRPEEVSVPPFPARRQAHSATGGRATDAN